MRTSCLLRATAVAAAAVLAGGTAALAGSAISFAPAVDFPTQSSLGPGPGAVTTVAGDVDGDGDIDVVMTDWFGGGPLVLRNDGRGSFGSPTPLAGAAGVGALAAGDLDRDGHLDLVGRDDQGVVVLLGNGDGTFRVVGNVTVSSNAQQSVAIVDTNGDGRLDIVTPARLGIQALLGKGDGTFTAGPLSPLMGLLADVKAANLDGDGVADLVVADATPLMQRVVALRGTGNGSFVQSGAGAVGYGPEAVMAGDLNGDGRDDAVSADSFSRLGSVSSFSISVLLGDGHGGFGAATSYATGNGPVSGALADFNDDGRLDVAVSSVGDSLVTVYAGDGTGRLVEAARLPVARQPQTPVAADFNGDRRVDLAVPGVGRLSVLRNTSDVASSAPRGPGPGDAAPPPRGARSSRSSATLAATGGGVQVWLAIAALAVALSIRVAVVVAGRRPCADAAQDDAAWLPLAVGPRYSGKGVSGGGATSV